MPKQDFLERPGIVYGLKDPTNNEIGYIGMTISSLKQRLSEHLAEAVKNTGKNKAKNKWIKEVLEKEAKLEIVSLWEGSGWALILAEITFIEKYSKIGNGLTNQAHNRPVTTSWLNAKQNFRNKSKKIVS